MPHTNGNEDNESFDDINSNNGDGDMATQMAMEVDDNEANATPVTFPETYSTLDIDAWNVTIYPSDLKEMFGAFTLAQLASYNKNPPRDTPTYANWVLVATINSRLSIHPDKAASLIDAIHAQGHIVLPSSHEEVLILGNVHMSIGNLADAMITAEIEAVRVNGYGMKHVLIEDHVDFGNGAHPLAHTNYFDFGTTWPTDNVVLFKPTRSFKPVKRQSFPMLTPIGKGYGSTNFKVRWPLQGEEISMIDVKVYPRLIHLLKAGGHTLPKVAPQKIHHLKVRESLVHRKLQQLESTTSVLWGGVRVEATLFAPTMQAAKERILGTPLLDIHTYTNGMLEHLQLHCQATSMESIIENGRLMMQRATSLKIFVGRHSNKTESIQRQVALDLCNSIGFNFGKAPTRWDHKKPWWDPEYMLQPDICLPSAYVSAVRFREPPLDVEQIRNIRREMQLNANLSDYFDKIRKRLACLVCQDGVEDSYVQSGSNPLRIRCKKEHHYLTGRALREYLIELIIQRLLPTPASLERQAHSQRFPWRNVRYQRRQTEQQLALEQLVTSANLPTPSPSLSQTPQQRRHQVVEVVIDVAPPRQRTSSGTPRQIQNQQPLTDAEIRSLHWRGEEATPSPFTIPASPPLTNPTGRELAQTIVEMHGIFQLKAFFLPRRTEIICPNCSIPRAQFNQCHQPTSF